MLWFISSVPPKRHAQISTGSPQRCTPQLHQTTSVPPPPPPPVDQFRRPDTAVGRLSTSFHHRSGIMVAPKTLHIQHTDSVVWPACTPICLFSFTTQAARGLSHKSLFVRSWRRPTWLKCPAISCYWLINSARYIFAHQDRFASTHQWASMISQKLVSMSNSLCLADDCCWIWQ